VGIAMLLPPSLGTLRATARADLLADWLRQRLGFAIEVRVASSYESLARAVLAAEVDLAWAPPSICAQVEAHVPAIYTAVRDGQSSYAAAIVAKDGRFGSVAELRGKRAAWVEPRSTGGYLLAIATLRAEGLDPDRDLAEQSFLGSYGDALRAVVGDRADFTSVFVASPKPYAVLRPLHDLVGSGADDLAAIAFTGRSPCDGLVVTRRLAAADWLAPLVDGRETGSYLLLLLEAERLVRASPHAYAALR
jgi:phosphonate transport system substrate-binding protein